MRILHYTLGLPPFRSGGLTRYASDLMEEQTKHNEVFHLYPGKVDFFNKNTKIIKKKKSNSGDKIIHFEIINSLPLPLFRGISQPSHFIITVPDNVYKEYLSLINPDVIHIHSLMGLHKEFITCAKDLGIRLVFTSHDYFGICPTINLYKDRENVNCNNYDDGKGCQECCFNAMNTKSLLLTQTSIYPFIKKIKKFIPSKKFRIGTVNSDKVEIDKLDKSKSYKYVLLREYYLTMLRRIDYFHFNSIQTEQVYKSYLPEVKGKVLSITHSGVRKNAIQKKQGSKIIIGYLGPMKEYKGFNLLIDLFKQLPKDYFELHIYGDDSILEVDENVFLYGRYSNEDLERIILSFDVVVVPSIWRETFGFVTLEALSFGTPVIVSENVGSKDLVKGEFGWKFDPSSPIELLNILTNLNKKVLNQKHVNINEYFIVNTLEEHSKLLIRNFYTENE